MAFELVYAQGQFARDGTQVALYDPATDRLEVIAHLSPIQGEHNNGPRKAISTAEYGIHAGNSFDDIMADCARTEKIWF